MDIFNTKKLIVLILLIISSNIFGQGTLQGVVKDSVSNDALVGANVFLVGTSLGSAIDINGDYRITKIPNGDYTVKVSYLGYKAKEFKINIQNSKTIVLNVLLSPEVVLGEEVVVTGQALGQAAAINQQLNSNTIVNVVSEQKIKELPDANAAESMGRLPGVSLIRSGGEANQIVLRGLSPQFATVTVDGVRLASTNANDQGLDLSTISQGSLAGIELFKALTSDKDADAIAGSVNLVTKKAPSLRTIRLQAFGDYNGMDKSAKQFNFSGNYGERFFSDVLGLQLEGHVERRIRSNESSDYTYDFGRNGGQDWETTTFQPQYINEIRKRAGGSVLLDFNTPDGGNIKFNSVYNRTSRDYLTSYRTYLTSGGVVYDYELQKQNIDIFNTSIHGNNFLLGFNADWNLAFSQSKNVTPYDYEMGFNEDSKLTNGVVTAGMGNVPGYKKGPVSAWIPYAINNWQEAYFNVANDNLGNNFEKIKTAFLNLQKNYSVGANLTGAFKFGAKYKKTNRSDNHSQSRSNYYLDAGVPPYTQLPDGSIVLKDFSGTPFSNVLLTGSQKISMSNFLDPNPTSRSIYNTYLLNPLIDRNLLETWRSLNINGWIKPGTIFSKEYIPNVQDNAENFYELTERTLSGYAMNTLNIGSELTVILGVRVESDNNDYTSNYMNQTLSGFPFPQSGTILDSTVNHKETNVLPNLQVLIKPTEFMNIRLASYQALARPNFNYRLPKLVAYQGSGANLHIGNPGLKNAVAWNYEIQTQFYGGNIGLFSISAFYKDIKNMFQYINGPVLQGPSQAVLDSLGIQWKSPLLPITSFNFYYPYNSNKPTHVWGFEVEHQANFRFLPGLLKNIVLNYNFSIVRSETWAATSIDIRETVIDPILGPIVKSHKELTENKQKLQDQPEFFGNVSLGYDIDGFSFRIAAFYQGKYNTTFSSDSRSDEEQDAFTRLDISLKQDITNNISVLLNLNNITNTKEASLYNNRYLGVELPNTDHKYGMTADLGVRVDL